MRYKRAILTALPFVKGENATHKVAEQVFFFYNFKNVTVLTPIKAAATIRKLFFRPLDYHIKNA